MRTHTGGVIRAALATALAATLVVALGACTVGGAGPTATTSAPARASTSATAPASTSTSPAAPATPADPFPAGPTLPAATATPQDVVTGLDAPWDLAFLPSGAVLVTYRDLTTVSMLTADGPVTLTGPGADLLATDAYTESEAGLLGIEVSPDFLDDRLVYLYRSTPSGNQVVRAELSPDGTLGDLQVLLDGIPHNSYHDGGRLAFGPDGYLYVTTGDAGDRPLSQDTGSPAGKILRITAEGQAAPGNPIDGNPMWSYGHRNVQGVGWTSDGTMYASEFGWDTWDELNVITPGSNYGWPVVEGVGHRSGYVDPVVTWPTDDASPSGIAVTDDAVYLAALRGERLWKVPLADGAVGTPVVGLDGLGRLRDVEVGPDGALWIVTNNTDGRGNPRAGDDRIVRITPP
ncbi:PQQ-dependent sugar dehydrogenase [Actinotalea sp. M2MS4P-6]|uniref:PQQ-dependent sugar dehydrogenase n=1 Tax=Actinotalea sp. M2MS4P-6 TaxID=2983762 RepID=UPI0021E3C513|nr:PQQ-dependent sugar dehydrogenase [Actinotalea sp. M2MS4P-6]MCV2395789.1 PQQ-dependent sugar dehydrogenase [Actinotalea sp. M2MS4P-6]